MKKRILVKLYICSFTLFFCLAVGGVCAQNINFDTTQRIGVRTSLFRIPIYKGLYFYGQGSNISLPITLNDCFDTSNIFKLYLSRDSFNTPGVLIGSFKGAYTSFINGIVPNNFPPGNNCRLRVVSTSPVDSNVLSTSQYFVVKQNKFPIHDSIYDATPNRDYTLINNFCYGYCSGDTNNSIILKSSGSKTYGLLYDEITTVKDYINPDNNNNYKIDSLSTDYYTFTLIDTVNGFVGTKSYFLINSKVINGVDKPLVYGCEPDSLNIIMTDTAGKTGIINNFPGISYFAEWGDDSVSIVSKCSVLKYGNHISVSHSYKKSTCTIKDGYYNVSVSPTNPYVDISSTTVNQPHCHYYNDLRQSRKAIIYKRPYLPISLEGRKCDLDDSLVFSRDSIDNGYGDIGSKCTDSAKFMWILDGVQVYPPNNGIPTIEYSPPNYVSKHLVRGAHTMLLVANNVDECSKSVGTLNFCIDTTLARADFKMSYELKGQPFDSIIGCEPFIFFTHNSNFDPKICTNNVYHWVVLDSTGKDTVYNTKDKIYYQYLYSDSTSPEPVFEFLIKGKYFIYHKTFNECPNVVDTSKPILVKSRAVSIFSPVNVKGCSPFTDTFVNLSYGDSISYKWLFGDGSFLYTSDSLQASHLYNVDYQDSILVRLIAFNSCGNDTNAHIIVVAPTHINVKVTVEGNELTFCNPATVHIYNESRGADTYKWDFGDSLGSVVYKQSFKLLDTVVHRYDSVGTYNIKIEASNVCTDTIAYRTVQILSTPKANFVATPDTSCIGLTVSFTNLSDSTTSVKWDFNDGHTSFSTNPVNIFSQVGNYNVQIIAERLHISANICRDTLVKQVTVTSSYPAVFNVDDSVGFCTPHTISFHNIISTTKKCTWDFGDSTPIVSGNVISHTYTKVGTFLVVMKAVDSGGCLFVGQKQITINGPAGSFKYDHGVVCGINPVRFEAFVSGNDSLVWDFGNGKSLVTTQKVVYYVYPQSGIYVPSVRFLAGSGASCIVPFQGLDTIVVDYVKAGFSYNITQNCNVSTIQFLDSSRAFSGLSSWSWDFGDQNNSTKQSPAHAYLATNIYPVELIVVSNSGCADTTKLGILIKVKNNPKVTIIANDRGCTNQPVLYQAGVTSVDSVNYYRWSFSNGSIATTSSTEVYYPYSSVFVAQVSVGTAYGCYDSTSKNIEIFPAPTVTTNPSFRLCLGQAAFVHAYGGYTYTWSPSTGINCDSCPDIVVYPKTTTEYFVTGYNNFGCFAKDSLLVTVIPPFTLTTSGNDTICLNDKPRQLSAFGASIYQWSPSTGLSATNIAQPLAKPALTTHYQVIGRDSFQCFTDTGYLVLAVGDYPSIKLPQGQVLSTGTLLPLTPLINYPTDAAGPILHYFWNPTDDLTCSDCKDAVATVIKDICYSLQVENIYGCKSNTDSICIRAFCKNTQVFIPNAFTPDGDGVNDVFEVRGKGIKTINVFRIFNRWGSVVFERTNFPANDASFAWDGRIKGVLATPDVFVYTCDVVCDNDVHYTYSGNVTLIR